VTPIAGNPSLHSRPARRSLWANQLFPLSVIEIAFCRRGPADWNRRSIFLEEKIMSKQQALLETLLGAAELNGDRMVAITIRKELLKIVHSHDADGYQRLARAASEPRRMHCKAA
jgi:hypothetical protein